MPKSKCLKELCRKKGITYIKIDDIKDEVNLDYFMDFMDAGHLNLLGAEKVTEYMDIWLKNHYDLQDYRGEHEYENWDSDYKKYNDAVVKKQKKKLD